jgi:hypothetical protein
MFAVLCTARCMTDGEGGAAAVLVGAMLAAVVLAAAVDDVAESVRAVLRWRRLVRQPPFAS